MDQFLSFLHIYSPGLPSHAISAGVTVASASNPPRNSCCCRLWRYWNPAPMAFHGGWCSLVWDALGGAQRSDAYPLGKLWRFHVEFPDGLWMYMVSPLHVSGWSGKCWVGIFLPRLGSHRHIFFLSMTDDKIDEHDQIDQMIQMIACEKRNWVQQAQNKSDMGPRASLQVVMGICSLQMSRRSSHRGSTSKAFSTGWDWSMWVLEHSWALKLPYLHVAMRHLPLVPTFVCHTDSSLQSAKRISSSWLSSHLLPESAPLWPIVTVSGKSNLAYQKPPFQMGKSSAIKGHIVDFQEFFQVRSETGAFFRCFLRYIQGDDRISQESCAVPNLTRLETFRWFVDLEGTAWTPPVAAVLDVWVLCTQSFKLLSMGIEDGEVETQKSTFFCLLGRNRWFWRVHNCFFLDDDEYRCKELQKRVPQQTTVKGPWARDDVVWIIDVLFLLVGWSKRKGYGDPFLKINQSMSNQIPRNIIYIILYIYIHPRNYDDDPNEAQPW